MCTLLFMATATPTTERVYNEDSPALMIEPISDEYRAYRKLFVNPNVYYVATSRGCACDFGLEYDQDRDWDVNNIIPLQRFFNLFRKLAGTHKKWEEGHREKVKKHVAQRNSFVQQTHELISIIETETKRGGSVELYFTNQMEDINSLIREDFDIKVIDSIVDFPLELGTVWVIGGEHTGASLSRWP